MEKSQKLVITNLIRLRNEHGITQAEASKLAGVGLKTYQKYEYGKAFPSKKTISKIADGYGVAEADLFDSGVRASLAQKDAAPISMNDLKSMITEAISPKIDPEELNLLSLWRGLTSIQRDDILDTIRSRVSKNEESRPIHKAK